MPAEVGGGRPVKAALYGRVSTDDKGQDPETQLVPMRELAAARGWIVAAEYVDHASASDLRAGGHGASSSGRPGTAGWT
ncbi:MAG TPA: recombinase family protein [Candidatus Dormibacteraeota bacterium]|nr:recombinase family protein [Candidatus Dormibacteraeota bacterium]HVA20971.1 recombinase family protein [Candidatus Micrarchaeia archaeon]